MKRIGPALLLAASLCCGATCSGTRRRDLDCAREPDGRRHEICAAVADNLKLSWGGSNDSLKPAYLLGSRELGDVFCRLHLTRADLPQLAAMRDSRREPRLSEAARELSYLLVPTPEMKGSRYDPKDAHYVLRGGCGRMVPRQRR